MFQDFELDIKERFQNINIRVVARNARKSITFLSGIPKDENLVELVKSFKKKFSCNGSIEIDEKSQEKYLKMSGDQSQNMVDYFRLKYPQMKINLFK